MLLAASATALIMASASARSPPVLADPVTALVSFACRTSDSARWIESRSGSSVGPRGASAPSAACAASRQITSSIVRRPQASFESADATCVASISRLRWTSCRRAACALAPRVLRAASSAARVAASAAVAVFLIWAIATQNPPTDTTTPVPESARLAQETAVSVSTGATIP